ncbi:H-NS family nucleoid-associated regulatory protein [Octadecabacter sp. R77987]|uniref:H-NS histone family protein n=1 Tax=Octadecabacter sp. R77987 TaxID=3093874 RepID=UPI00367115DA
MTNDLSKMNRKALEKLASDVDKALRKIEKQELKAARAAAEKAARAHGFSLAQITGATPAAKKVKKAGAKSAPKYANPANRDQTWTGKGRQPDWYKSAIAAGTPADDMAI